jgi:hypothetical protein
VGIDDDESVRRCPKLRIGGDVEAALLESLRVTWIVESDAAVDGRAESLIAKVRETDAVFRRRDWIQADEFDSGDDEDGDDGRRRIHVTTLGDVTVKDFSHEDVVVLETASAAAAAAAVTVVGLSGMYDGEFHIVNLDDMPNVREMKMNILTLLPARHFHWGNDSSANSL